MTAAVPARARVVPVRRLRPVPEAPSGPSAGPLAAALLDSRLATAGRRAPAPGPAAHVPALDGLRGVAVAMVVAFHLQLHAVSGGFVGVDVFFVLSGYLITGLLVRGQATGGSVGLRRFWSRRARRLLPALFVLLAVLVLLAAFDPGRVDPASLRTNGLATLLYVQNWHLALQSHTARLFEIFAPSPLEHTWSLAMEEQFYLLWPFAVAWALRRRRGRPAGPGRLWAVVTAGTIASVVAMAAMSLAGAEPLSIYYDGGARAFELLVGAAVALALPLGGPPVPAPGRRPAWAIRHPDAVGAGAGVGAAFLVVVAGTVPGIASPWLYRGGMVAVVVAAAVVVAGVVAAPDTLVPRLLAWRPLVALGRISYGVYLWHWPVLVLVTTGSTGLRGLPLILVQLGLTLGVSVASYRLVEQPLLRGSPLPRRAPAPARVRRVVPATRPVLAAGQALAVAQPTVAMPPSTGMTVPVQ